MNSNRYKILIIEDETNIRNFVKTILHANGYQVLEAGSSREGMMMYLSHTPDCLILDLGLPDGDGIDFITQVRKQAGVPILVLSARTNESDKVEALDAGANDYVTKPFGTAELLARVRAALRIYQHGSMQNLETDGKFRVNDLVIDFESRQVMLGENEIHLTQTEYNIAALLARHAGKVMTYSEIIREVWRWSDAGSVKKLQVNMANIRKKMGVKPGDNRYISNELGVGYRMNTDG
ncbi:MAG: response regulator transcription factor [Lachnospiraceae bacterium]|nr:response regulator transcription factor [Lachnospiraceae bacterium]